VAAVVVTVAAAGGLVDVMQTSVVRQRTDAGTIRASGVEHLADRWSRLATRWTRFGAIPAGRGESLWVDRVHDASLPPGLRPGRRWLAWQRDAGARPIGSLGVFLVPEDRVWVDSDAFARRLVTTTDRQGAKATTTTGDRPRARLQPPPHAPPAQEVVEAEELEAG
jgi:hypothetical protein